MLFTGEIDHVEAVTASLHQKPALAPNEHVPESDYSEPLTVGNGAIEYVVSAKAATIPLDLPAGYQRYTIR